MMRSDQHTEELDAPRVPPSGRGAYPFLVVLISAHEDRALVHRLDGHLRFVREEGRVGIWGTHALPAGSDVLGETLAAVAEADVILLAVSPDLFGSHGFSQILGAVLSRLHGGAGVVPLLMRPFYCGLPALVRLRPLPANGIPVVLWGDSDAAFADVARGVRELIHTRRNRRTWLRRIPAPSAPRERMSEVALAHSHLQVKAMLSFILIMTALDCIMHGVSCASELGCERRPVTPDFSGPGAREAIAPSMSSSPGDIAQPPSSLSSGAAEPADGGEELIFVRISPSPVHAPAREGEEPAVARIRASSPEVQAQQAPSGAGAGAHSAAPLAGGPRGEANPASVTAVVMSQGAVIATLRAASTRARRHCRAQLADRGGILIDIAFDAETGRPTNIVVHSSTLDDDARACVANAFAGTGVQPGNGGYRVTSWPLR